MARMIATTTPEIVPVSAQPLQLFERFCANCRRLMAEQNLSQIALTELVNEILDDREPMTRPAVMQKINGKHEPSLRWIEIMARAFEVSVEELTS